MKVFSSRRRVIALAALLLVALFLLRPGASRLKTRIIFAISSAVGRSVDIGAVHVRLLPWPGFDLENLVVYDDPTFGAEPMLRSSDVTASLRLNSLLHGRIEIARLDLTEPSLNLVRGQNGRWNVETLLERTARIPLAPTAKAKSEPRPGFPYIEAGSARINFKNGLEKKPYALSNADFSVWQESENSWGLRLKAQPVRTDLNLNDTGLLQVNGTWQRSDSLSNTPLHLNLEWNRAQLGQFTKLLTGNDQGWRGEILLDVELAGTPADLQVSTDASIQDFRRYDITSGTPMRLAARCTAVYSAASHSFHEILCSAPVGAGSVTLKGSMGFPGTHDYALVLALEDVPASAAAMLAQRAKSNLPEDLVANGSLQGTLHIDQNGSTLPQLRLEGRGEIAGFRLASVGNKADIVAETVPFLLTSGDSKSAKAPHSLRRTPLRLQVPSGPHLELGPFPLSIGRTVSPTAWGWINRSGYGISIFGDADVAKALRAARMAGLPALQLPTIEGSADLDLQIAGTWLASTLQSSEFSPPQVTGAAKLRNLRIVPRGLGGPIEIASADMQLSPDEVQVMRLNVNAAGAAWKGSVTLPRGCGTSTACEAQFALHTAQTSFADLRQWVSPSSGNQPWYHVLKLTSQPSFLSRIRAAGAITADRFRIQNLEGTRVSADLTLDVGRLQISAVTADFLGGQYTGEWQADFSEKSGDCTSIGSLTGASLAQIAEAMNDGWISGAANTTYALKGPCTNSFWTSAEGTLQFEMKDGALPRVILADDSAPLKFSRFAGQAELHDAAIELKDASLFSPSGKFQLNGSATLKGELDLKLSKLPNPAVAYTITGTVDSPQVNMSRSSVTQARLKP